MIDKFIISILLFLPSLSFAQNFNEGSTAISIDIGIPDVKIKNPDNSEAIYDGFAASFKFFYPLLGKKEKQMNLFMSLKLMNLENTTRSNVSEDAQILSYGSGIDMTFHYLQLGYSAYYNTAKHQFVSILSNKLKYNMISHGFYLGLIKRFKQVSFSVTYNIQNGEIDQKDTGLAQDSDYKEQNIMFNLKYEFGISRGQFLKFF